MFQIGGSASNTLSSGSSTRSSYVPIRTSTYLKPFKTRRVKPEDAYNWAQKPKTKQEKFARRLPLIATVLGLCMIAAGIYWGYTKVPTHKYSEVIWFEDFSSNKLDLVNDFNREVSFSAFGANSLEWNTDSDNNTFVKNNQLYIKPTLTDLAYNVEGVSVNLTADGSCTVPYTKQDCFAERNATTGAFINAVQSARLTTQGKHSMRYGRLEINAKLPHGDWFWPAIWLLPESTDIYGIWPASGEIDMLESRGNKVGYPGGGYDTVQTSIHMAPVGFNTLATGGVIRGKLSNPAIAMPFTMLPEEFHTYGMDWTPQYISVWVDDPIYVLLKWEFKYDPFTNFALPDESEGEPLISPWTVSNHKSAPFDEKFYLILNCAVGGIPGYFSADDAPWSIYADYWSAQKQVWEAREEMSKTWDNEYEPFIIDWIKMTALEDSDYWENQKSALYN